MSWKLCGANPKPLAIVTMAVDVLAEKVRIANRNALLRAKASSYGQLGHSSKHSRDPRTS
jgi:hypothetical protein